MTTTSWFPIRMTTDYLPLCKFSWSLTVPHRKQNLVSHYPSRTLVSCKYASWTNMLNLGVNSANLGDICTKPNLGASSDKLNNQACTCIKAKLIFVVRQILVLRSLGITKLGTVEAMESRSRFQSKTNSATNVEGIQKILQSKQSGVKSCCNLRVIKLITE